MNKDGSLQNASCGKVVEMGHGADRHGAEGNEWASHSMSEGAEQITDSAKCGTGTRGMYVHSVWYSDVIEFLRHTVCMYIPCGTLTS